MTPCATFHPPPPLWEARGFAHLAYVYVGYAGHTRLLDGGFCSAPRRVFRTVPIRSFSLPCPIGCDPRMHLLPSLRGGLTDLHPFVLPLGRASTFPSFPSTPVRHSPIPCLLQSLPIHPHREGEGDREIVGEGWLGGTIGWCNVQVRLG